MGPTNYQGFQNYDFVEISTGVAFASGDFSGPTTDVGFQGFADMGWSLRAGLGFHVNEMLSISGRISYSNLSVNKEKMIAHTEKVTGENILSATTSSWHITSFFVGPSIIYSEGFFFFNFGGKLGLNGVTSPNIEMVYSDFSSEGMIYQQQSIGYGPGFQVEAQFGYRINEIIGLSLGYDYSQTQAHFQSVLWEYKNGINQKIDFDEQIQLSNLSLNIIFYLEN